METMNAETYMRLALQLAAGALGQTGVNPVVGCVIVKDGRVVGLGAHLQRGSAHAEVHALQMAGADAAGATAYVTLEPCSHHGRTPPCCDRLIADKVAKVVVACVDPNPQVAGTGIARLQAAGIETEVGLLGDEARRLNEMFAKYIVTRTPFVTLKTASTLDGRIATNTFDSKWVTGEEARAFVHTLRHRHQAIMVGVGTLLADNPSLTTRLPVPALHPVRIVVDSLLRTPPEALAIAGGGRTIVATTAGAPQQRREALLAAGAELLEAGDGPRVDLALMLRQLGEREIGSVLLEGGGTLNGAMLEGRLIDKCHLLFAPKLIGGNGPGNFDFPGFARMSDAIELAEVTVETIGRDICVTGYPVYERSGS
ncbi:MAG: bifunctional diaminohydroxyphosphoribosylaminopyrimidine deaminase/5-amino-6-(5-phosphoribosylamino)uracil reductase RibD [Paenibacillaceae bacterium]|nr:bifunctional diaminohydroxyphosphoribosylaminopyrimidine deaminase/5-amino-6-(5-phosphoribosylamino)uracil reductase RibD [Paenibacillaceae bacterium]